VKKEEEGRKRKKEEEGGKEYERMWTIHGRSRNGEGVEASETMGMASGARSA